MYGGCVAERGDLASGCIEVLDRMHDSKLCLTRHLYAFECFNAALLSVYLQTPHEAADA